VLLEGLVGSIRVTDEYSEVGIDDPIQSLTNQFVEPTHASRSAYEYLGHRLLRVCEKAKT